jgi:hypothetical protein
LGTGDNHVPRFDQDFAVDGQMQFGDSGQTKISATLPLADPFSIAGE